MNKRTRLSSLIALVLVLCMLFSFCSVLSSCGDDDDEPTCSHTNTSLKNQKAATCSAAGYTGDIVCNDCTAVVTPGTATAKLAHTSDAGTVTKNPTCMETGVKTFTCTVCAAIIKTEAVATVAHQDIFHDAQDGNHFHTCLKCTLNASEEHRPADAGIHYAATCVSPAYTQHTCADCGGVYKIYSSTELALGHDMSDWVLTESTCLATGSKTQSCKRDGCTESHSLPIPVSTVCNMQFSHYEDGAPTCTEDAVAVYVCVDCGAETTKDVPATGVHKYVQKGDGSDGFIVKNCEFCNDTISSFDASQKTTANVEADKIDKTQPLEMAMKEAAIQFPTDVVGDIAGGADLEVSADTLDETAKNTAVNNVTDTAAKEALKDAPVYDFTVKVDGSAYTENFSSKVTITLPYDNGDNDSDGIVIYYLAENGEIEAITNVVYNAETKEVTFFVDHFSFYAVAFQETQAMRCKRGNHAYAITATSQAATCYQFGYTLYECSECHKQTIDDIAERLEHAYGDIIEGKPTCENGAWAVRICANAGCADILQVSFAGATGHTMDKPATCETPSTCTVCSKTLARALGHNWTDWQVVKQPTEAATGLRRRNCTTCGKTVEETLATTGTIEPLKYDSYSDIINLVGELLNIKGASFDFTIATAEMEIEVTLKMSETSNGYRMAFTAIMPDGTERDFFYDNGALVILNGNGTANSTEIDHLVPITIELYKEVLEDYYVLLDEYAVQFIAMADQLIVDNKEAYAERINGILASLELEYTYDDLAKIVQSVENVYAYLSIKLGYTTSAKIEGDVILPTSEDFRTVLELFMTKTEENGVTTYAFDEAPLFEAVNKLLAFLEENSTKSLAEVFYVLFGEAIAEKDATLTSFDAIVDFIAVKFPGTFTVADAIDMYIDFAEESGFLSLEELYAILDSALAGKLQPGASVADMVDQMGEMTLDQLAAQMMNGATMADLYAMIKGMAAEMTFGDLGYNGMTVNQIVAMGKGMLPAVDLTFDITFKFNANGELIAFEITQDLAMQMDPEAEPMEIDSISVKFVRDDSVAVEIPASLSAFMNHITTSYDKDGNLIVQGLPVGPDYKFSAIGGGQIAVKDVVVYDQALSDEAGYDVYTLKEEYWSDTQNIGRYYLVNGNYYYDNFGYVETSSPSEFFELSAIKNIILEQLEGSSKNDGNMDGGYKDDYYDKEGYGQVLVGTDTPVQTLSLFGTRVGMCYKDGETWKIAVEGKYGVLTEGVDVPGVYFLETLTLDEFVASLKISSTIEAVSANIFDINPRYEFVLVDGRYYPLSYANISYAEGKTFRINCVVIGGSVRLFNGRSDYRSYHLFNSGAEAVTLPEHDNSYSYSTTVATFDAVGNLTFVKAKSIELMKVVPSYFIKITDDIYKNINSNGIVTAIETGSYDETLALPDGKTLYVDGRSQDTEYFYSNGYTAVFGYVRADSGVYVQTIALVDEGENVADVLYRYADSSYRVSFDYFDVDSYVTEKNGVYTVSAALIAKLKALCQVPQTSYYLNVNGTMTSAGIEVTYGYVIDSFMNVPEISLGDIMGGIGSSEDIWYKLFGSPASSSSYDIVINDDGSVTLVFSKGSVINNIQFPTNAELPTDDLIVKNEALSEQTGLDIYTFNGSYTTYDGYSYVYRNGKYYNYDSASNYSLLLADKSEFIQNWRISDSRYRFNMVGEGELADGAPVYETEIEFSYRSPYSTSRYMTVYTFFLNGIMYAAVEAEATGESLLKFERYMPLDEYMDSLVFELRNDSYSYYSTYYVDGKLEKIYINYFDVYETDENGAKLQNTKYQVGAAYIIKNGVKKFIKDYSYLGGVIKLGSEVTPDTQKPHTRDEYVSNYYNGAVTIATFRYENTYTYSANFIKLAGRLYRYDSAPHWNDYYTYYTHDNAKLTEDQFNNMALDKVWYYVVVDEEKGTRTYYSEFIPSDFGFTPKNQIDPSSIVGEINSETLLGYTPEGLPIYEEVYYVGSEEDADWTRVPQADGTVFCHKNGMGYLEVTEKSGAKYYVRARMVEMADGTSQVFCFLLSGKLTGSEANQYVSDYFDGYLSVQGNKLTITEKFLEVVNGNNKNDFYIQIYIGSLDNPDGYFNSYRIDGYRIETFFMMGDNGSNNNSNNNNNNVNQDKNEKF